MAIKIAVANMKGGIGKTTTSLCLADCLQHKNYKVLLIDADPQCSATGVYNAKIIDAPTLADIMYYNEKAESCIQTTKLGDIIASDSALMYADSQVKPDDDRPYHLKDNATALDSLYDFIICDCPPGNTVLLDNVLTFVDYVIIPLTCDKFGLQGMSDFKDLIAKKQKRNNRNLSVLGVLIVKYKGRQTLTQDFEEGLLPKLVAELNTTLFNTKIRESVKCQESQALGVFLSEYDSKATTMIDYKSLTEEILKKVGGKYEK